mgnify:CR=1 FL=1
MGSIFILNKRNALKYLRKPIHEVLDNKIIYININDNNCVHKIHNSMLMFRRNIVTYNIYFSDSLTSKNRLATVHMNFFVFDCLIHFPIHFTHAFYSDYL